jgi:hypothetical protein
MLEKSGLCRSQAQLPLANKDDTCIHVTLSDAFHFFFFAFTLLSDAFLHDMLFLRFLLVNFEASNMWERRHPGTFEWCMLVWWQQVAAKTECSNNLTFVYTYLFSPVVRKSIILEDVDMLSLTLCSFFCLRHVFSKTIGFTIASDKARGKKQLEFAHLFGNFGWFSFIQCTWWDHLIRSEVKGPKSKPRWIGN